MPAMTLATTSRWRSEYVEGAGDRSRTGGEECVRRGEVNSVGVLLDCCWTVVGLLMGWSWTVVEPGLDCCWTIVGLPETICLAGKGVMTRAGVGEGKGRETTEGGDRTGTREEGRGLMAAERSSSSAGEGAGGNTRVRPSSPMVWSLCLSQHR